MCLGVFRVLVWGVIVLVFRRCGSVWWVVDELGFVWLGLVLWLFQ